MARELGIAMIHQELSSRTWNVCCREYLSGQGTRAIWIGWLSTVISANRRITWKLGINLNPKTKMKQLRKLTNQQMVEIAKAISQNAGVVIMDEPTSSITDKSGQHLKWLEDLASGVGIYLTQDGRNISNLWWNEQYFVMAHTLDTFKASEIDEGYFNSQHGRTWFGSAVSKSKCTNWRPCTGGSASHSQGQYEDISFKLHKVKY